MKIAKQKLKGVTHTLHDQVAPQLFISKMQLELFIGSLGKKTLTEAQHEMLIKGWRALEVGYENMRQVMTDINEKGSVDPAAFFPTLKESVATFNELLPLEVLMPDMALQEKIWLNQMLGVCLAELLTNALKHSNHPQADVCFEVEGSSKGRLLMTVCIKESCAKGPLAVRSSHGRMGEALLKERLKRWGGGMMLETKKGYERCTQVWLPLEQI